MPIAKTVLLTGAGGFIGSHCVPRLIEAGYEVHGVTSRPRPASPGTRVVWHGCDLLNAAACVQMVETIRPTHLLHLAWVATPGAFWTSPANLRWLAGGISLVDAFFRNGGRRAVGAGTCAEYAWGNEDCGELATPLRPVTVYGCCKLALGLAFTAAAAVYRGSSAWARLFFPYGPGEPPEKIMPSVIRGLLRREPVDCTHGNQVRDFIYVDDVAAALVALLDSAAEGPFNVGSGCGMALHEVVAVITRELGHSELVRFGVRQPPAADPDRIVADIHRIKREVGWQPAIGVEEGVARSIAAWRSDRHAEGSAGANSDRH